MNIVLLYGGRSGEHEISVLSCAAVARKVSIEHKVTLVFIDRDGAWYVQDETTFTALRKNPVASLAAAVIPSRRVHVIPGGGPTGAFWADGKVILADVVFPVLHGTYGEDGTVQGLLELARVPYVGCGVFASAATMDKEYAKILWEHAGLPVVPYRCINRADVYDSKRYDQKVKEAIGTLNFPLFVKPCGAGSSDGAAKATNAKELSLALTDAFTWDNKVLIEKAINAREVECSVMGNTVTADADHPETLPVVYGPGEIVPNHDFYDYDAKYNDPDGAELCIPAKLEKYERERIRTMAQKAYVAVDASGMARVDFFIDRDNGFIYLNELNSIPGFTSISMFPKLCESEGLNFAKLLETLFTQARYQFLTRTKLRTTR
ncbi:MAG: D-alanine--D-alanine ligase [Treponema sp.]|nr:D-alanine--D-alanine ligase [Treponema sp.]